MNVAMETLRHTAVILRCGKLDLDGVISSPVELGRSSPGVVVCHPHPLLGGDMHHPVVTSITRALGEEGFFTLRFNFRGVGESQGSHDNGVAEINDLEAAVDFLAHWPGVDKKRIGVAGYSFGAMVALSGLQLCKKSKAFALVSPPGKALDPPLKLRGNIPLLFVVGTEDATARAQIIEERIKDLNAGVRSHLVPGANHFWRGREVEVARIVSQFFEEALA